MLKTRINWLITFVLVIAMFVALPSLVGFGLVMGVIYALPANFSWLVGVVIMIAFIAGVLAGIDLSGRLLYAIGYSASKSTISALRQYGFFVLGKELEGSAPTLGEMLDMWESQCLFDVFSGGRLTAKLRKALDISYA